MAEIRIKTDLEERFDVFKKQYHDRQAEAQRTGKPIPAHVQRWYDRHIEEYRVALKRLGVAMVLDRPDAHTAIERVAAVKQELDAVHVKTEEEKADERRERVREYTKQYRARLTDEEKEVILAKKRLKNKKWREKQSAERKKVEVPTAKMLVAESVIAEAIESGRINRKLRKSATQAVRILQASLSKDERTEMKRLRDNERQNRKRWEKKIAELRERTVEVGWVDRALETDEKLRELFDAYVGRSLHAAVWYRKKHGLPCTDDDVEAMRAHRVFTLKLEVDANHDFLNRIEQLRLESLQRSYRKQYAKMKSDPAAWEAYSKERSAAYRKKMQNRQVLDVSGSPDAINRWMEAYETAKLMAVYEEEKKDAQKVEKAS